MESQSQRPPRMSRGKLVVSVSALLVSALIFVGIPLGEKYISEYTRGVCDYSGEHPAVESTYEHPE